MKYRFLWLCLPFILIFQAHAFSIKEGLKIALENDKDIQTKNNSIEMILDEIRSAEGLNYPVIDFTSNVQKERLTGSRISTNDYNRKAYDWEFILRQPLYDGRDAHYEEKLQRARYESAKYYMLESANAIALQYIEAYLNVLREKALMEFSQESLSINQEIFNKNKVKFDKGFATLLEFERSQAKLNESIANHASQMMNYEESLITLRNFIQFDVDSSTLRYPYFAMSIPNTLEAAKKEAYETHPSVKVSDNNIQVAMNEYKREQKRFHPHLDLVARYGGGDEIPGLEQPTNEYSIGLEVRYNLYNGGKDMAASQKAQKYIEEKRILSERSRQQIENRLRLAWNAYQLNDQKLPQMRTYTDSKKAVLETTMVEYDLGTADLNLLLTTQDEYIISKKAMIVTQRDLLLAKYRIREAIGDVVERLMLSDDTTQESYHASGVAEYVEKSLHVKHSEAFLEPELLKWNESPSKKVSVTDTVAHHNQPCYNVKSKILNVRQEPNTKSPIVGSYTQSQEICGNEWDGIWLKTSQGWVSNAYLTRSKRTIEKPMLATPDTKNNEKITLHEVPEATVLVSDTEEVSDEVSIQKPIVLESYNKLNKRCYIIKSKTLNVREEPNAKSPIVATYIQDEKVCGSEWQGIWLKTPQGWVSNAYLQRIKTYASAQ
jgi:adhesin transport system outer membrane protein